MVAPMGTQNLYISEQKPRGICKQMILDLFSELTVLFEDIF